MSLGTASDLEPGTSVGQYTLKRRIGSGGMGEVYEAVHTGLDKRVAIKTLRRQYAQNDVVVTRFLREGQVASRIRHPNVVDVTDVGMIDGLPCLVMEYLEGESLHNLFKREGALELSRLVDLMLPVIAAVDVAHQLGVVHRDLKPANIFLTRSWSGAGVEPKVLDFGISKVVQDAPPSELTTDSTFLGSPHYVSPELARGDRNLDGRSDQYAIGVVLYEGACGVRPFAHKADTFMALMFAISQGDFSPPRVHRPELPEQFEQVVLRAMAKQRNDRYPSLVLLGRALLPFASPRTRLLWEPVFAAGAQPLAPSSGRGLGPNASTVADIARPGPLEESHGTIGRSGSFVKSQLQQPAERPLGTVWWLGASVAALLLGLGLAIGVSKVVTLSKNQDTLSSDVEGVANSQSYAVNLKVTPETASIELDGRIVATGTYAATFTIEGGKHKLRVFAPEYATKNLEFDATSPPPEMIALERPVEAPSQKKKTVHPSGPNTNPAPKSSAAGESGGLPLKTDNRDPWDTP